MEPRSLCIAAALAALTAVPPDALAQSAPPQNPRDQWTLLAERGSRDGDQGHGLRTLFPDSAFGGEIGWLRSSDFKPGSGLRLGTAQGWALSADWDRQRPRTPQVREPIDTLLLGIQYKFR